MANPAMRQVTSPSFERMLDALHRHGCRVQRRSDDSARATCPTHRDARPSLVVTRRDGLILVHCFAGCRVGDIVRTLGLTMADLFDGPRAPAERPRVITTYPYTDLNGEIIAEKVRFKPKGFRWRSPDPAAPSGWRSGFNGIRPGLYRLPELIDAREVLVVEGEKAVDCLRALGFAATCPPAGASAWLPRWSEDLWQAGCADEGRLRYNLGLFGRAKKNWKTADLGLAALHCLVSEPPVGYESDCYILANDADQARDDLSLVKKLVKANDVLQDSLTLKRDSIERRDARGFLQILPAQDVVGSHGKSYRFCGYDEIHGYRTWDILEAMQPDPHRQDAQVWITSYATIFHRPGVPLFDLCQAGWAGKDLRCLFSWYAADRTTDPDFVNADPETRANPSQKSWADPHYLAQQAARLPAHKYRRLHLNLPGLPEGSAFQPEPVMDAIARGLTVRAPEPGIQYVAFVDMSGGSNDDAVLGIGHRDADGCAVLDSLTDQGQRPPFDPNKAVDRFVRVLRQYRVTRVVGDRYAGLTFASQFTAQGVMHEMAKQTTSELYEALEPRLNSHHVVLLDVPTLAQQLLGLVWRGGKIDHQPGEHDDYATAVAGVAELALSGRRVVDHAFIQACLESGSVPGLMPTPPDEW